MAKAIWYYICSLWRIINYGESYMVLYMFFMKNHTLWRKLYVTVQQFIKLHCFRGNACTHEDIQRYNDKWSCITYHEKVITNVSYVTKFLNSKHKEDYLRSYEYGHFAHASHTIYAMQTAIFQCFQETGNIWVIHRHFLYSRCTFWLYKKHSEPKINPILKPSLASLSPSLQQFQVRHASIAASQWETSSHHQSQWTETLLSFQSYRRLPHLKPAFFFPFFFHR